MTDQNRPEDAIAPDESPAGPVEQPNERASTSPRPPRAASGPSAPASEELPYIDDPVSKWWIAIIVAVFALIFAWAIFFGAGGLFDGILGSDDATPSPEATVVATIEPTQGPTAAPEATAEAAVSSPGPVMTRAPEPTLAATTEPEPTGAAPAGGDPPASPQG
jgi:hypothetical protein